jgi:tRNA A-37 threonylcarbamoyl transferase component Bud32/sugar lactone lactonase YvrE
MITDPRIGTEVAGYRIESVLGRGGMSVVYLAEHASLKRKAAVKILAPDLASDERFRDRFVRESQIAAGLDHPNIVPIYEAGDADGVLFIAMRYVRGTDLKSLVHEEGALSPERTLSILSQVASALDAAHGEGLVHRDVKPGNVLLSPGGRPGSPEHAYLSDFGVTKRTSSDTGLTGTGQFIGTLDYAAPEQIEGRPLDARTDVYSLGCVLYECLTGQVPFPRDSDMAILWAHMSVPPPRVTDANPDLPPAIDDVVARGMAKSPQERFETCGDLLDAARAALIPAALASGGGGGGIAEGGAVVPAPGVEEAPPAPTEVGSGGPPRPPRRPRFGLGGGRLVPLAAVVVVGLLLVLVPILNRGGNDAGTSRTPTPTASGAVGTQQGLLVRIDRLTERVSLKIPAGAGPMHVAVGEGSTWVADQMTGSVVRFDREGKQIAKISLTRGLSGIAVGLGTVWVTNRDNGKVYGIDPGANTVRDDIPVGIGIDEVVVGVGLVWVVNNHDGYLARVDPQRKVVIGTSRGWSGRADLSVAGGAVWMVTWMQQGPGVVIDLWSVDPVTGKATQRSQLVDSSSGVGSPPAAIVVAAGSAWVTAAVDHTVRQVDLAAPDRQATIPTGRTPVAIAADSAGFVWVANRGDNSVWKISTDTGQAITPVQLPGTPTSIAAGNGAIWVTVFPREAAA